MADFKNLFLLLVTCLDGLVGIVELEPSRQIGGIRVAAKVEKGTVVILAFADPTTFPGNIQRIRKGMEIRMRPDHHLIIPAHPLPVRFRGRKAVKLWGKPGGKGFAIDFIAHLDQPGQIGTGAKIFLRFLRFSLPFAQNLRTALP